MFCMKSTTLSIWGNLLNENRTDALSVFQNVVSLYFSQCKKEKKMYWVILRRLCWKCTESFQTGIESTSKCSLPHLLLHFEKKCSIRLAFFRRAIETRKNCRIATKVISIESRANLENSVRRSVGLSVCRSVGLSVCPSHSAPITRFRILMKFGRLIGGL